jgi:hypothetical protein
MRDKTGILTKLKIAAVVLLSVSLVASGAGVLTYQALADSQPKPVAVEAGVAYKADLSRLSEDAAKRYVAIKPRPGEVKWRQIPWLVNLNKGIQVAKEEKRPLLIWTGQQSHPLERC